MACDSCQETTQCIDCPPALTGVAGSKLYSIHYAKENSNIYNGGSGYTEVLYTNATSGSQTVFIETNCSIETTANPHTLISDYLNDGVSVGTSNPKTVYLQTKSDHTHFLIQTTVLAGKTISLKLTSDDASAKLKWIVSIIYVY